MPIQDARHWYYHCYFMARIGALDDVKRSRDKEEIAALQCFVSRSLQDELVGLRNFLRFKRFGYKLEGAGFMWFIGNRRKLP